MTVLATSDRYETMLKIQKRYDLRFRQSRTSKEQIHGQNMSFSSFPGGIQSGDDFYLMSSGLATLETTIENYNKSLWSNVKPIGQVRFFIVVILVGRIVWWSVVIGTFRRPSLVCSGSVGNRVIFTGLCSILYFSVMRAFL